jgi:type I restriction enzyme S subunit
MIRHQYRTILGPIPDDWAEKQVRSLLSAQIPGDWGDDAGAVPLGILRSTNFTDSGNLDRTDVARRWFSAANADRIQVRSNDILLERSGGGPDRPVGRVVQIPEELPTTGFANFVQCLRPDQSKVEPQFLLWTLFQLHRSGEATKVQHQTTQMRNLDLRDYLRLQLPFPERREQVLIGETLAAADANLNIGSSGRSAFSSWHSMEF